MSFASKDYGLRGWLKKRGEKGLILELTWKNRYFIQTGPTELSYFKDAKPDATKKGFIDLAAVLSVSVRSDVAYGFEIKTPGRTYLLQALTDHERQAWIDSLTSRCPKLKGGKESALPAIAAPLVADPIRNSSPARSPTHNEMSPSGRPTNEPVYVSMSEQVKYLKEQESTASHPSGISRTQSNMLRVQPKDDDTYASFSSMGTPAAQQQPQPEITQSHPNPNPTQPAIVNQPVTQFTGTPPMQHRPSQVTQAHREEVYMSSFQLQQMAAQRNSSPAAPNPVVFQLQSQSTQTDFGRPAGTSSPPAMIAQPPRVGVNSFLQPATGANPQMAPKDEIYLSSMQISQSVPQPSAQPAPFVVVQPTTTPQEPQQQRQVVQLSAAYNGPGLRADAPEPTYGFFARPGS